MRERNKKEKMKTLRQEYQIQAPIGKVWKALTDMDEIAGWGAGPGKMDEKTGKKFFIWDSKIWGENIESIPNKKLVQEWYGGKREKPSKVTFTLHQEKNITIIKLLHENIPDNEAKDIDQGWRDYYPGPLKEYVEKS